MLALVVLGHIAACWPGSRAHPAVKVLLVLVFFAVVANVCYCAVYAVDLFVQFSGLREPWATARVAVLAIGTAFAAVIAHFVLSNIFGTGWSM